MIEPDITLCPYSIWQTQMYLSWCRGYVLGYMEYKNHIIYDCAYPKLPEAQEHGYAKGLEAKHLAEIQKEEDVRWCTDPLQLGQFFTL